MITLYGFGRIFPEGIGETKDMRVQWVLEETGLPYKVHALDHGAGDLDSEAYVRVSPFHQVPVIEDDGFAVAESGAIALYLAEKSGKLMPRDVQGRTRVSQWCFAAAATVGATLMALDLAEIFDGDKKAEALHSEGRKLAARWHGDLDRYLQGRQWIASDEFSVADIMLACVLRSIRKTDMLDPFPNVKAYYERCIARPAWERTLTLYAERLGVSVDSIR